MAVEFVEYIFGAKVAEWLEWVLGVWEVSGLIPGKGGHKNLWGCR